MKLGPRAKLVLLASLFLVPIVASMLAYLSRPEPTANYGGPEGNSFRPQTVSDPV